MEEYMAILTPEQVATELALTLSTHSEGGLTGADFALARQVSELG
jgi:pterin-4a-carbinolamine dehydratase